jgi:hypothetical protein
VRAAAVLTVLVIAASVNAGDTTWRVRGRVTATACAGNRCATRQRRVRVAEGRIGNIERLSALCECLEAPCDGPETAAVCTTTPCTSCTCTTPPCACGKVTLDTTLFGAYTPTPTGARFAISDRPMLRTLLRRCFGNPTLSLTAFDATVSGPDASQFSERVHLTATFDVQGQSVDVTVDGRFHGVPPPTAILGYPPSRARGRRPR